LKTTPRYPALSRHGLALLLLTALLLAGCRAGTPSPEAVEPAATASTATAANAPAQGGDPVRADPVDAVPTRVPVTPVEALAQDYPAFDGLYWTGELGVEPLGANAARLSAAMSCADLLDLLSSGEWRLVEQARPRPESAGMLPLMALMELGDRAAFVEIREAAPAQFSLDGEPLPEPDPAEEPLTGCAGLVWVLPRLAVSAAGVEAAEGEALQYPLFGGCTVDGDAAQVRLFYEGPGDFRASVEFAIPAAVGEYATEDVEVSLAVQRSGKRLVETFSAMYARGMFNGGDEDDSAEFYPTHEDSSRVVVRSARPLAGEIILTDYASETTGRSQSFRAPFQCP
jgi:hypothetical protein